MTDFLKSIGFSSAKGVLQALLLFVICLLVIKIVMKTVDQLLQRSRRLDAALKNLIRNATRALLWVLAVILVANALGIDTASLVALLSVAGLALSLSVQNVMTNLFSGVTLLLSKPFGVGDFVELGGKTGVK